MDHRLGMDEDIKLFQTNRKKVKRLNQFKALVHHRCGIDADLCTHVPIGMRNGLRWRNIPHFLKREGTEGSAACGQGDFTHLVNFAASEALEYGVMLTIDGKQ